MRASRCIVSGGQQLNPEPGLAGHKPRQPGTPADHQPGRPLHLIHRWPTARTTAAHQPDRACGHCAPALRAGALLASPDAQQALHKPFLT